MPQRSQDQENIRTEIHSRNRVPAISTALAAESIAARWRRTLHIRRQTCRGESALRTTKQKDGIRAREPGHIRVLEHSRTTARPERRTWGCVRSDIAR